MFHVCVDHSSRKVKITMAVVLFEVLPVENAISISREQTLARRNEGHKLIYQAHTVVYVDIYIDLTLLHMQAIPKLVITTKIAIQVLVPKEILGDETPISLY